MLLSEMSCGRNQSQCLGQACNKHSTQEERKVYRPEMEGGVSDVGARMLCQKVLQAVREIN